MQPDRREIPSPWSSSSSEGMSTQESLTPGYLEKRMAAAAGPAGERTAPPLVTPTAEPNLAFLLPREPESSASSTGTMSEWPPDAPWNLPSGRPRSRAKLRAW